MCSGPGAPDHAARGAPDHAARGARRRLAWAIVGLVVAIGTPVGLAIAAGLSAPGAAVDGADDVAGATDLDGLSGRDAALAGLLAEVDRSEEAMVAFQRELERIATAGEQRDRGRLLAGVRSAAKDGVHALAEVRPRLAAAVDDGRIESVRTAYLAHHDAWADYLDAVLEEPALVTRADLHAPWRLAIDATGETFADELRDVLEPDAHPAVRAHARDILRRGFGPPAGTLDA